MERIKNLFNNLDKTDLKIMKNGLKFCFMISIISTVLLIVYLSVHNLFLYELGIAIFKFSLYIAIEFIVCGIVVDTVKKESEI